MTFVSLFLQSDWPEAVSNSEDFFVGYRIGDTPTIWSTITSSFESKTSAIVLADHSLEKRSIILECFHQRWTFTSPTSVFPKIHPHSTLIYSINVTSDSSVIITGASDGDVRSSSALKGEPLKLYSGHVGDINSIAFIPKFKAILTAGSDYSCRFFDLVSGQLFAVFPHQSPVIKVLPSNNFDVAVSMCRNGAISVLDLIKKEITVGKSFEGAVDFCLLGNDEIVVLFSSKIVVVSVHDLEINKEIIIGLDVANLSSVVALSESLVIIAGVQSFYCVLVSNGSVRCVSCPLDGRITNLKLSNDCIYAIIVDKVASFPVTVFENSEINQITIYQGPSPHTSIMYDYSIGTKLWVSCNEGVLAFEV
ncbi:hypothetical protein RCL1_001163 [Eukaryota sp. TZLM3-RCL]